MKKVLLAVAAAALMAAPAMAVTLAPGQGGPNTNLYHSYDGLVCSDCHTIHNSEDGAKVAGSKGVGAAGPFQALLKKGDYSDMCLSCHKQGYNTAGTADMNGVKDTGWTAPIVMTTNGATATSLGIAMPAGDFYFANGNAGNQSFKKGHNPAYTQGVTTPSSALMAADTTLNKTPPGGTVSLLNSDGKDEWSCHSCHGMHDRFSGSYIAYRQLQRKVNSIVVSGDVSSFGVELTAGGNGATNASYEPILSNSRGYVDATNTYQAKRADNFPLEGAVLTSPESVTNKNVYRGGFSSFCSACHGDFHGGNGSTKATQSINTMVNGEWLRHPTNLKLGESAKYGVAGYTKATKSQDNTLTNPIGYDFKYPLVQPSLIADDPKAFDVTVTADASTVAGSVLANDRIMCLTCHKAHATEYANMTRWDATGHAFLPAGGKDVDGSTAAKDTIAYGCGKCHQKGGAIAWK